MWISLTDKSSRASANNDVVIGSQNSSGCRSDGGRGYGGGWRWWFDGSSGVSRNPTLVPSLAGLSEVNTKHPETIVVVLKG